MDSEFKNTYLTTGSDNPLLPQLIECIEQATHIYIAVSFIKASGMKWLYEPLKTALAQKKMVKILTSDYMRITDPDALDLLLQLKSRGAEVRVFESIETGFHMKAYIFLVQQSGQSFPNGCAFIGSSNISDAALLKSVEWNIRFDLQENPARFISTLNEFDKLFKSPPTCDLTAEWLAEYQTKWKPNNQLDLTAEQPLEKAADVPQPNEVQREALIKLDLARKQGLQRGLVVLATGLGKTWLSAFDSKALPSQRILFIAHREEILKQAQFTFSRIYPQLRTGVYAGKTKDLDAPILFASIQTLGKLAQMRKFSPGHFDYIVVDEFHHAAAKSYQKLLNYFSPKFLLGLTATPNRTDQVDILDFCDGNLIYEVDLFEGINRALLCPFNYYGIEDKYVDYTRVAWRQGKFLADDLELQLNTLRRAQHIYDQWLENRQTKTLAFCLSKKHAEYMAAFFQQKGISTAAIHSSSEVDRHAGLDGLSCGQYPIIFSVDLFNEGVDLPLIDTVMLLRPTESKILFLQQLGRGLRRVFENPDKKLHVLDFIGNHHVFLNKPQAMFELNPTHAAVADMITAYREQRLQIPVGCEVFYDLEVLDIFQRLTQPKSANEIITIYAELKENKGRRPTASEFFQAGVSFTKLRQGWGSWFDFVHHQGDLSPEEEVCLEAQHTFFGYLETTKMTKSFKMLTLEAWFQLDGFIDPPTVENLADLSLHVLHRRAKFRQEVPEDFQDVNFLQYLSEKQKQEWRRYWRKNPIQALTGGNTDNKNALFYLENDHFHNRLNLKVEMVETFADLAHELIAYRLFRQQPQTEDVKKKAKLANHPGKTLHSEDRDLSRYLFEPLMREEIPPIFGLSFNPGSWNSGHVTPQGESLQILLVTLIKTGKAKEHRYHDYFVDAQTFHWQSQNKTSITSNRGQRLKAHGENREPVYLFVRKHKLGPDKKAAPFIYCGEVKFQSWKGSQPINIVWDLKTPLSQNQFLEFSI